jgi:hypoxanthine-DNA glycosylase
MVAFNSYSFPPILGENPRILVLGSMPGIASIKAQQYYAHPRNAFWPIMAELYDFDVALPYEKRCQLLIKNGIALWDVLSACYRPGSLDQHIDEKTAEANDFGTLFSTHPNLDRICFNGQKSAVIFKKRVRVDTDGTNFELVSLPSTSPAHASMSPEMKQSLWQQALFIT